MYKRIVVLGDLHVGSILGVAPDKYNPKKGNDDKLYELRKYGTNWLLEEMGGLGRIDYLVLNGDLVEGKNYKGHGREVIMPDMSEQMLAARDLICQIQTPDKYVFEANGFKLSTVTPVTPLADSKCGTPLALTLSLKGLNKVSREARAFSLYPLPITTGTS